MATDDDTHAEQQAREYMAHAEELASVRFLAGHAPGRRFLRLVLDWTGLIAPAGDARREGQRDVGRRLLAIMDEVDPMLYPSLCADQAREEVARRQALERISG